MLVAFGSMDRTGREFELLVREIERLLMHAYGVRVEQVQSIWRYRPIGRISGKSREVDVAIFVNIGVRRLLFAIECRDWNKRQGVRWIEQLASKRKDIDADRMIAVARAGFTPDAVKLAKAFDIELHTLSDRELFKDEQAIGKVRLRAWRPNAAVWRFSLGVRGAVLGPDDSMPELSAEDGSQLCADIAGKNWVDSADGSIVSLMEILAGSITSDPLLEGVPVSKNHVRKWLPIEIAPTRYTLARQFPHDGKIMLFTMQAELDVWFEPEVVDAERVLQYRSAEGKPMVELHMYDGDKLGRPGQVLYVAPVAKISPDPSKGA